MTSTLDHVNRQREIQILAELNASASAKDRRRKLLELYAVGSDLSVPALSDYLLSDDDQTRVASIHALSAIATDAAVSALTNALRRQTNLGISFTASALAKLSARTAIPALAECLRERQHALDGATKLAIIRALATMPQRSEVPALASALTDRDRRVRQAAARALAALGMPDADAALNEAARKSSWFAGRPARPALSQSHEK